MLTLHGGGVWGNLPALFKGEAGDVYADWISKYGLTFQYRGLWMVRRILVRNSCTNLNLRPGSPILHGGHARSRSYPQPFLRVYQTPIY